LQSAALESAATGVLITDINGVILWVNPAFTTITGFSAQEAIGKNPRILNSGTHDLQFFTQLWKTILAGQIWQHETINRRKDGRIYVEEQTIAPVRDASGQISHFISTKQDITQRKQLEELRDELMHTIVHDLRNPLTSMLASLDMLEYWREQLQLEKEPVQILQIARTSAWRMLGLVNTILDLYKLESGKMQLKREPLVLTPLVEQIFRIESPLAIRREVLLLNNIPFDLPVLNLDQLLIGRVIQNLIDNALRYTPDGGNVEVSACYDPQQRVIILSVHDQGPGVPPEAQSRLFQKFVSSSKERGTGLGLAFCRLAVEAHNGRIWAESEPGQGTTFLVSLPLDEISTQESIV
jgi:PAS domain S-box-containing protein